MKAAPQNESQSQEESSPPTVWAREPDATEDEPNHAPEGDEGQVLEEPGYGHGV